MRHHATAGPIARPSKRSSSRPSSILKAVAERHQAERRASKRQVDNREENSKAIAPLAILSAELEVEETRRIEAEKALNFARARTAAKRAELAELQEDAADARADQQRHVTNNARSDE